MDNHLAPLPQGVPQRQSVPTGFSALVQNETGVVDVPTFSQFVTGDAGLRSMDSPLSKDTEGAVPSCSEAFNSASGAQDALLCAPASFHPSQSRVLEQCGAAAASLRHALSLGDYALGVLSKDITEGVLDEVHTWGHADDEEAFTNILIFTDDSGTMTNTGRIRGPAPVQRVAPQCFNDTARGSKRPSRTIQLEMRYFFFGGDRQAS